MTTLHTILSAAALGIVVVTSGCLHHPGLLECVPGSDDEACWQSGRSDDAGRLRHHVVERVTPAARCDLVEVEQSSFAADGTLIARVVEQKRCRVVERRTTDTYDLVGNTVVRTIEIDLDHDDRFDTVRTLELPMTDSDRTYALSTGAARYASLAEARDRAGWNAPARANRKSSRGQMAKK